MSLRSKFAVALAFAVITALLLWPGLYAQAPPPKAEPKTAVSDAERADCIKKGLAYLAEKQRPDGGWQSQGMMLGGFGIGFGPAPGRGGLKPGAKMPEEPSDLGCTCLAVLAFVRAGNTVKDGEYSKNVAKGVDFIIHAVGKMERTALSATEHPGTQTQLQFKIGPHVDTFLALLALSELKGKVKDEKAEERLVAAVHKLIARIEASQKKDGTYPGNTAWAPVLSQGLASKALNRASQAGFTVKTQTFARDYDLLVGALDRKTGRFAVAELGGPKAFGPPLDPKGGKAPITTKGTAEGGKDGPVMIGDAGVTIYGTSARAAALQELANTMRGKEDKAKETLDKKDAVPEAKQVAKKQLELREKADDAAALALKGVNGQLDDKRFLGGFGSNGGEEFLSFMNISEALHARGGDDWVAWDKRVAPLIVGAQDKDGAWSGNHCITGRTACTAFALLTLMADRAPSPGAKEQEKK
jgi:hypothetical protein